MKLSKEKIRPCHILLIIVMLLICKIYIVSIYTDNYFEEHPYNTMLLTLFLLIIIGMKNITIRFMFETCVIVNLIILSIKGLVEGKYSIEKYSMFLYSTPFLILLSRCVISYI